MVPEGWVEGRVGNLIGGLESGVSVNAEDRQLHDGEKGVLKVSAVSYGFFDKDAVKAITSKVELKRAKTTPKKGQIIISRSNTDELVGASAYIEEQFDNLYLPDKLWQTIPIPHTNMKWLSYVLASGYSRFMLSNLSTGTSGSMKNITKGELLSLKVRIPPLPEQRKIAQILSTWDKAIATTEKLITASQQQKKALMQQLLTGKKRLLDPETGKAFAGDWEKGYIYEIALIDSGFAFKSSDFTSNRDHTFPILRMSDFKAGGLNINDAVRIPEDKCQGLAKYSLDLNDFVFGMSGSLNNYGWVKEYDLPCYLNQRVGRIRAKESFSQMFVTYLYLLPQVQQSILDNATGAAQLNISISTLGKIKIKYPKFKEQQKIAAVLTAADHEIELLTKKLYHLQQEKKALMQQLLTGKKRVTLAQTTAA